MTEVLGYGAYINPLDDSEGYCHLKSIEPCVYGIRMHGLTVQLRKYQVVFNNLAVDLKLHDPLIAAF